MIRRLWMAAAITLLSAPVTADGPIDHKRALEARKSGEIRPLAEILEKVRPQLSGEIIKIEIEREDGRWVYEFKILRTNGSRTDIYVDGKTGKIIREKEK
ncbi:MAG: PepSY domain-containing protein [Hyphomicrobiales bacterium]|nr:PepSY domain-containing protein [Hyphomicrobiales bacterium]